MTRRTDKNYNTQLLEKYRIKPIAYNPRLAAISKSATAGLFLSQLLYWWGKGRNKSCIYKTVKELQKETQLTRSMQERAIKIWEHLGVLAVRNKGIPPKRHFDINLEKVENLLSKVCDK